MGAPSLLPLSPPLNLFWQNKKFIQSHISTSVCPWRWRMEYASQIYNMLQCCCYSRASLCLICSTGLSHLLFVCVPELISVQLKWLFAFCLLTFSSVICQLTEQSITTMNTFFLQTERKIRIGENIAREMSTPSLTYADSNAKRQTYRTTVKNATKRTIQTKEECERHINIYNWTWMLHAYSHVKLDHFEIQIRGIPSRWFFL